MRLMLSAKKPMGCLDLGPIPAWRAQSARNLRAMAPESRPKDPHP
jgi:hypothetical protein